MNPADLPVLVIATRNSGKLREFQTLLRSPDYDVRGLSDFPDGASGSEIEESGSTFAENACLKAVGYSLLIPFPVLADDSGLEVDALGGRPGIHSARYAGTDASDADRISKLTDELKNRTGDRSARFVCALALAKNGKVITQAEGICSGVIISEPRGAHGFGYDPVFLFPDMNKTFAELNEFEKNQHSHRFHAVVALQSLIVNYELFAL